MNIEEALQEPMTATEIRIRHLLLNMQEEFKRHIQHINYRLELCEKVFIKIMQHDIRLQTLEFNSDKPVQPSASEKLLDMQLRLERLESYLLNGERNDSV